jgi:hypothetical protein
MVPPELDVTNILTSMTLGNVIRYYYNDPINTGTLPAKCIVFGALSIIFSFIFLHAGCEILKYVSSMKFSNGGTFSVGQFSIYVENLPKDLMDAKKVFFFFYILMKRIFLFLIGI